MFTNQPTALLSFLFNDTDGTWVHNEIQLDIDLLLFEMSEFLLVRLKHLHTASAKEKRGKEVLALLLESIMTLMQAEIISWPKSHFNGLNDLKKEKRQ